jgi:DNA-binding NtrC family response regulator
LAGRTKLRVLIVDDDPGICQFLKEVLGAEGYVVATCSSPTQVVDEVKQGRYQVVLLDIRMPEITGVELLQRIRAVDSDICVIVMTAYPSVDSAVETMKLEAFDYLRKPFDPDQLRAAMRRAIRERGLLVDAEERLNQLLGTRLRGIRKEHGLTLKQLANKTSLSVSLISQIELGKSAASVSTLRKLSTALGVPLARLLEGL